MNRDEKEIWYQWHPEIELPQKICIEGIDNSDDEFIITFKSEELTKIYSIAFDKAILSFRSTPKKGFDIQSGQKSQKEDFSVLYLYKVEKSKYLRWYSENFPEYSDISKVVHYVFCDKKIVLEVLSAWTPIVTLKDLLGAKRVKLIEDGKLAILRDISKYGCPVLEIQQAIKSTKLNRFLYRGE